MTDSVDDFLEKNGEEIGGPDITDCSDDTSSGNTKASNSDAKVDRPSVLSSAQFVRGFVPPNYVIDAIVQRHRIYSCTAKTGDGKTAVTLRLLASVALGRTIGGHDVEQGSCLMLVGENPDDVRARWIALSEQMGFIADDIDVHFMPGVFPIADLMPLLQQKAQQVGGFSFVGVDTGAAYFDGLDENDNKQMGDYARRLRTLAALPGQPCVVANCHPTKNAPPDALLPRGGGAFLAEMDGNLTCKRNDTTIELHWQGKFRGPDFAPVPFELVTVTSPKLVDSKGRTLPTVYARPLTDTEYANREAMAGRDQRMMLIVMSESPGASISDLASKLRWVSVKGAPMKSKVHRLLELLRKQKLAAKELGSWFLTPAGEKVAKKSKDSSAT